MSNKRKIVGATVGTPIKPSKITEGYATEEQLKITDDKVNKLAETVSRLHGEGGAIVESASGETIILDDASDMELAGLKLYGKTTQNGTPTPDAPVALDSVGDDGSLDVTVCGKNMYNVLAAKATSLTGIEFIGDAIRVYSLATSNDGEYHTTARESVMTLRKGVTYTLSCDVTNYVSGEGSIRFRQTSNSTTIGSYNTINANGKYYSTYTPNRDIEVYVSFFVVRGTGGIKGDITFSNVQLEIGSVATEYEAYKEAQTLPVPILSDGLHGIPVSSGGNYTDDSGQQWVCDEVDFQKGQYIQRIGKITCDGSSDENWITGATVQSDKKRKYIIVEDKLIYGSDMKNEAEPMLCDRYSISKNGTSGNCYNCITSFSGVADNNRIYFYDEAVPGSDLEAWRNYLAEHPVTVIYPLAEEKTIPLSDIAPDALAQYAELHTNYPNSTIFNDESADMAVKYVADTKLYIDKKFAELATALVNNV